MYVNIFSGVAETGGLFYLVYWKIYLINTIIQNKLIFMQYKKFENIEI